MLRESHSITRGSQKHALIAVFIFITARALETLNVAVCRLVEKLWPLPHCLLSNFREGTRRQCRWTIVERIQMFYCIFLYL